MLTQVSSRRQAPRLTPQTSRRVTIKTPTRLAIRYWTSHGSGVAHNQRQVASPTRLSLSALTRRRRQYCSSTQCIPCVHDHRLFGWAVCFSAPMPTESGTGPLKRAAWQCTSCTCTTMASEYPCRVPCLICIWSAGLRRLCAHPSDHRPGRERDGKPCRH